MEFDWDVANVEHLSWHGVVPEEAEDVLYGDYMVLDAQVIDGEVRHVFCGLTESERVLTVVWTVRRGRIRVVTAFPSSLRDKMKFKWGRSR